MKKYYFAGGMYYKEDGKTLYFGAVRPTGGLPYLTLSKNGLSLTSHHSSLYELSKDFRKATLINHRSGGVTESPKHVTLSENMVKKLKESRKTKRFFD